MGSRYSKWVDSCSMEDRRNFCSLTAVKACEGKGEGGGGRRERGGRGKREGEGERGERGRGTGEGEGKGKRRGGKGRELKVGGSLEVRGGAG